MHPTCELHNHTIHGLEVWQSQTMFGSLDMHCFLITRGVAWFVAHAIPTSHARSLSRGREMILSIHMQENKEDQEGSTIAGKI